MLFLTNPANLMPEIHETQLLPQVDTLRTNGIHYENVIQ